MESIQENTENIAEEVAGLGDEKTDKAVDELRTATVQQARMVLTKLLMVLDEENATRSSGDLRRSRTLGCCTSNGPAPVRICRPGRYPLRTTRRLPCSSRICRYLSRKEFTSVSRAACSMFLAPSNTNWSMTLRASWAASQAITALPSTALSGTSRPALLRLLMAYPSCPSGLLK